ncbi:RNA-directed DNA polymerase, eukaryota [Tanacetum coccineum]
MWGNYAFDYACSLARGRSGEGKWTNSNDTFFMINVYGPYNSQAKALLWNTLRTFIVNHSEKYLLFGDLNEVSNESERFGSLFSRPDAQCFNSFIYETNLVEVMMGGRIYTWMNKSSTKMSKLDRFLMSNNILNEILDLKATVLEIGKSNHNPILLHVKKTNYGPYPFKFFHSWLIHPDFDSKMKEVLTDSSTSSVTGTRLKDRLKLLKVKIKEWFQATKLWEELHSHDLDRISGMDLAQKAHSHWDIEVDKNTKYFHGLINQRRRQQMVKGVMIEGVWCSEPVQVKQAFFDFFEQKFQDHESNVVLTDILNFCRLSDLDRLQLDKDASVEEIKNAVWDCGSSKAPGPDGFSFLFLKTYWDLLKDDVVEFISSFLTSGQMSLGSNSAFNTLIPKVHNPLIIKDYRPISLIGLQYKILAKLLAKRLAEVIDKIVSHEQSAFISGRQILDGPLMLSEVIEWYKKKNKKLMIFKVDFEKAYDSVSWSYLDYVLIHFGFSDKWRGWIRACLQSARTSILVNGSPTKEFSFKRGVSSEEVVSLPSLTGCSLGNLPFKYLGLPIGANMNQVSNWNILVDLLEMVNKLLEKLRATFFWGRDNENRKTSWINWPQVLAPKAHGGLGIGTIHGEDGGLISTRYSMHGTLANVVSMIHDLHNSNIIPYNYIRIKLGCGSKLIVGLTIDGIGIGEDR